MYLRKLFILHVCSFWTHGNYKDRLFCLLFGNEEYKDNILSLYNALCNTSYMMILENLAIADNKGKTYGLGRGTNHARIDGQYCQQGTGTGKHCGNQ